MEFKTFRRTLLIAAVLFVPAGTSTRHSHQVLLLQADIGKLLMGARNFAKRSILGSCNEYQASTYGSASAATAALYWARCFSSRRVARGTRRRPYRSLKAAPAQEAAGGGWCGQLAQYQK